MSRAELKPCPFCGGAAELDYSRSFRAMSSGNIEQAVAIYCLECSADMALCRSDHREYDAEQLADILTENWNRRAALEGDAQPVAVGEPATTDEILSRGMPFGYDPATGFFHADDGGAPASAVFYVPKPPPSPKLGVAVEALADLVSWFDGGPSSYGPWIIKAGPYGADEAVKAAREALSQLEKPGE